jgi:hypothetical protein
MTERVLYTCTVRDAFRNNRKLATAKCRARTKREAKLRFSKQPKISKYIGNFRYKIEMIEEPVLLQAPIEPYKNNDNGI